MRYQQIILRGLKYLAKNGIHQVIWSSDEIAQILIGTNGCGKSRVMAEISPLPAKSSDYAEGGLKQLYLYHDGHEFILTSDFSRKSKAHSFVMDGVELNEGGAMEMQSDLVREHLGYTAQLHLICANRLGFTATKPAERRQFLAGVNPVALELVFDRQKAVQSQIRGCKLTLTRLLERKATLEADLIDPERLAALTEESQRLSEQLARAVEYGHRIDERLRAMQPLPQRPACFATLMAEVKTTVLTITRRASGYHDVPRDGGLGDQLSQLQLNQAKTDAQIDGLSQQLTTLAGELDQFQGNLARLGEAADLQKLNDDIAQLSASLAEMAGLELAQPWSLPQIASAETALPQLESILGQFIGCGVKLVDRATLRRKSQHLANWRFRLSSWDREAVALQTAIEDAPKDSGPFVAPEPCAKYACPLFRNIAERDSERRLEQQRRQTRLAWLRRKLDRLEHYIGQQSRQLDDLNHYTPYLGQLFSLLNHHEHGHLRACVLGVDILHRLRHNPLALAHAVRQRLQDNLAYQQKLGLQRALEDLLKNRDATIHSDAGERELLRSVIAQKTGDYQRLRQELAGRDQQRQRLVGEIALLNAYRQDIDELARLEQVVEQAGAAEAIHHELQQLTQLARALSELRQQLAERLGGISHTLKTQASLRERHSEEVVGQISAIEQERDQLVILEQALAGIPHKAMVYFINSLLATANRFIRQVFTYPLQFKLLAEDAPLDYRFPVLVEGVPVPDMSEVSEAQHSIINLGITLALMVQLKLTDYPLLLDEPGKGFDHQHERRLLDLIRSVLEGRITSQLFLVHHQAVIHEGVANAQVFVLDDTNIITPANYNQHVELERSQLAS